MTQKELLYLEDAVKHERNMISILEESSNYLDDESLIEFMNIEKKKHEKMCNSLLNLLESEAK